MAGAPSAAIAVPPSSFTRSCDVTTHPACPDRGIGAVLGGRHDGRGGGTPTSQESGNPINDQGSSYHYRTYITSITPKTPGLSVEVLEFADRLLLRNHTGKTVTVYGYSGEPYARVLPDGAAEQNKTLSRGLPEHELLRRRRPCRPPPARRRRRAGKSVDRTGQFEWHDHRIHWMSPVTPPEVKDTGKRTKIFDWTVPIEVGDAARRDQGRTVLGARELEAPTGAIVAVVADSR